jgi:TRAP-type mannitol/chloroaromatic compound transport system substrate-binding protein
VARAVTLLAFGCPPAAFGLDARTLAAWHRRAGAHCERVHNAAVLSAPQDLR